MTWPLLPKDTTPGVFAISAHLVFANQMGEIHSQVAAAKASGPGTAQWFCCGFCWHLPPG
eukprot:1156723-Pelagomonas_calceolata.AAC.20